MYKYETHCHTSETSACGHLTAYETIKAYKKAGFSGVCITDHYRADVWEFLLEGITVKQKVHSYFSGIRAAREAGDEFGIDIIAGMELTFTEYPFDYLVYGITEDFLLENPFIFNLKKEQFGKIARENGFLFAQAHPFRPGVIAAGPDVIEGFEVLNGNPRHFSDNAGAYKYAKEQGFVMLSGSDCHQSEDIGIAGIILESRVTTANEFIKETRKKMHRHIILKTE